MLNTHINKKDYRPYYIQVKDAILEQIESGELKTGGRLPGEVELGAMFNVSRTVIRQALKELEIEQKISREKGKGTFITEPKINYRLVQELVGFFQDAVKQGQIPFTKVLKLELVKAPLEIAEFLEIKPGAKVIKMHRLRGIKKKPLILDFTYLPYELCPQVLDTDFSSQSLYAFLEEKLGLVIARAHRTLYAVSATEYVAKKLELNNNEPVILFQSIAYLTDNRPIEYFQGYHSCRDSQFTVDLVRIRD
jgi:GntR family transcriptional regulator